MLVASNSLCTSDVIEWLCRHVSFLIVGLVAMCFPQVIRELKDLAGDESDDEDDEEVAKLSEEATMPIQEVLNRLKEVCALCFIAVVIKTLILISFY